MNDLDKTILGAWKPYAICEGHDLDNHIDGDLG